MKTLVQGKKLQGISDVKDLTDRKHGLRLVIEVKNGFNPEAVLEQLYKLTPMEDSFGINSVALVDGQPQTLGLKDLLRHYVEFRIDVVRRRTAHRLRKAAGPAAPRRGPAHRDPRHRRGHPAHPHERGHRHRPLPAHERLRPAEIQANHILDLQLRRLTKFSRPRPRDPARRAARRGSRSSRPSSATRSCCTAPCPASSPTSPRSTAPRAAPCSSSRPATRSSSAAPLEVERRPLLGAAVLDRAARAHVATTSRSPRRVRGPSTTPSSPPSARPPGARWGCSRASAG